ncbi:McrB family protein [Bacteroidota bacterium]
MISRLKNLYTHLVDNGKHHSYGWYDQYKLFCEDIIQIRKNLNDGAGIDTKEAYQKTSFENKDNPFKSFVTKLLYDMENGVSSRGQSVLSWDGLNEYLSNPEFPHVVFSIVSNPNWEAYTKLREFWEMNNKTFNPVLINRALAACNTELSSTVDEPKFDQVFNWLQKEGLISKYTSGKTDWYHKNKFTIAEVGKALSDSGIETDPYWRSIFVWALYENLHNPFQLKKQLIKYGAPGTGKTYTAEQDASLQFEIWKDEFNPTTSVLVDEHVEKVQFHPSYTYEDFMEGLRPVLDTKGQAQLSLQNGVFKNLCITAGEWECEVHQILPDKDWTTLTIGELLPYKDKLSHERWEYIWNIGDHDKKVSTAVPPYFVLIDEINRAELSRVFGELMYCLEYRGAKKAIKTQYSILNKENTGMLKVGEGYQFFIPHNVFIIGTMNTIDRSVESFDFAMRRRFRWEEVSPNPQLLRYHLSQHNKNWENLAGDMQKLNAAIEAEPLLGSDYQIGHSYFWDLPYSSDLTIGQVRKKVWDDNVEPLLSEYLRGTGRQELVGEFKKKFGVQ